MKTQDESERKYLDEMSNLINQRPCEVCDKTDLPTAVVSSTLGAMSNNLCYCCSAMGAELSGMQDLFGDYVIYNKLTDQYTLKGEHIHINLKNGLSLKTRDELVKYINRDKK